MWPIRWNSIMWHIFMVQDRAPTADRYCCISCCHFFYLTCWKTAMLQRHTGMLQEYLFIYLFNPYPRIFSFYWFQRERERERERKSQRKRKAERERKKINGSCCLLYIPKPGIEPQTYVCALTGNRTCTFLVSGRTL